MHRWKPFLVLCLCICAYQIHAQFNDTTNYYVNCSSTGILNKTNDNRSYVLNNNFKFSIYKKHVSLNTTHNFTFGKQNEELTNRDFTSALDGNLYKTLPHLYYWGLAVYERSVSLKIHY